MSYTSGKKIRYAVAPTTTLGQEPAPGKILIGPGAEMYVYNINSLPKTISRVNYVPRENLGTVSKPTVTGTLGLNTNQESTLTASGSVNHIDPTVPIAYHWLKEDGSWVINETIDTKRLFALGDQYDYAVYAVDAYGNYSHPTNVTIIATGGANILTGSPVVRFPASIMTHSGGEFEVDLPMDTMGQIVSATVEGLDNIIVTSVSVVGAIARCTYLSVRSLSPVGNARVGVLYTDSIGVSNYITAECPLVVNQAPVIADLVSSLPSQLEIGETGSFVLNGSTDPEGGSVTYTIYDHHPSITILNAEVTAAGVPIPYTISTNKAFTGVSGWVLVTAIDEDGVESGTHLLTYDIGDPFIADLGALTFALPANTNVGELLELLVSGGTYTYGDGSSGSVAYLFNNISGGTFVTDINHDATTVFIPDGEYVKIQVSNSVDTLTFDVTVMVDGRSTNVTTTYSTRIYDTTMELYHYDVVVGQALDQTNEVYQTTIEVGTYSAALQALGYTFNITSAPYFKYTPGNYALGNAVTLTMTPWIVHPTNGSTTNTSEVVIRWNRNGLDVSRYLLLVGTTVGASDLVNTGVIAPNIQSMRILNAPIDGSDYHITFTVVDTDNNYTTINSIIHSTTTDNPAVLSGLPPLNVNVFVSKDGVGKTKIIEIPYKQSTIEDGDIVIDVAGSGYLSPKEVLRLDPTKTTNMTLKDISGKYRPYNLYISESRLVSFSGSVTTLLVDGLATPAQLGDPISIQRATGTNETGGTWYFTVSDGYVSKSYVVTLLFRLEVLSHGFTTLTNDSRTYTDPDKVLYTFYGRGGLDGSDTVMAGLTPMPITWSGGEDGLMGEYRSVIVPLSPQGLYLIEATIGDGGFLEFTSQ